MKRRKVNFEVLRIVAMLLIISGHFFTHTNLSDSNCFSPVGIITVIYKPLFVIGVNLFILITGYFQSQSEYKREKLLCLWQDIFIWSVVCCLLGIIYLNMNHEVVPVSLVIKAFFPIFTREYWFMTTYVVLYLLSPYINKILILCEKKDLQKLLMVLFVFFSVWSSCYPDSLDKTGGFGIIWFVILYITGAYIRQYGVNIRKTHCAFGLVLYETLMVGIRYFSVGISSKIISGFDVKLNAVLYKYNFPLVYFASILVFLLISNSPEIQTRFNKIILLASGATLDIYLLHENPFIRKILWNNIPGMDIAQNNYVVCILYAVFLPIMIYAIGCILVIIKKRVFHWIVSLV